MGAEASEPAATGQRHRSGGRPSKGPRHVFSTARIPIDDAREVIARANAAGQLPYTELIAALVHVGLQHLEELPERFHPGGDPARERSVLAPGR